MDALLAAYSVVKDERNEGEKPAIVSVHCKQQGLKTVVLFGRVHAHAAGGRLDGAEASLNEQYSDISFPLCPCRTAMQGGAAESMRTLRVDDSTVLKLAIGPSLASVAVTTFQGLYLADFSSTSGQPGAK